MYTTTVITRQAFCSPPSQPFNCSSPRLISGTRGSLAPPQALHTWFLVALANIYSPGRGRNVDDPFICTPLNPHCARCLTVKFSASWVIPWHFRECLWDGRAIMQLNKAGRSPFALETLRAQETTTVKGDHHA